MEVKVYSTHCPKCKVLCAKLEQKGVEYTEVTDVDYMMSIGINSLPMMQIDGGELIDYPTAIRWINGYEIHVDDTPCDTCTIQE